MILRLRDSDMSSVVRVAKTRLSKIIDYPCQSKKRAVIFLFSTFIVTSYGPTVLRELSDFITIAQCDVIPNRVKDNSQLTQEALISGTQFRDDYFQPILDTFRNTSAYARLATFRGGLVPKVLFIVADSLSDIFWSESLSQITKHECPLPCTVTDNISERETADAILVYLMHVRSVAVLNSKLSSRDLSQPWIVHSHESPLRANKYYIPFSSLNGVFNRTMFYRRDADISWTHGFIVSKKDGEYLPPHWRNQAKPIQQLPFYERKPVVAFISNCANTGGRMEYVEELANHIRVDIFGRCGNMKCGKSRWVDRLHRVEDDECLENVAKEYLFHLSFENAVCEDYVTEKAYNIQYYPVVPIVYGGADYTKLLPPNSYIEALQFTPKQLANHLQALAADETKYQAMLAWREHYVVSTVAEKRIYCQLCSRLYDPEFYKENVYDDFHNWFVSKSKCSTYSARNNITCRTKIL